MYFVEPLETDKLPWVSSYHLFPKQALTIYDFKYDMDQNKSCQARLRLESCRPLETKQHFFEKASSKASSVVTLIVNKFKPDKPFPWKPLKQDSDMY